MPEGRRGQPFCFRAWPMGPSVLWVPAEVAAMCRLELLAKLALVTLVLLGRVEACVPREGNTALDAR